MRNFYEVRPNNFKLGKFYYFKFDGLPQYVWKCLGKKLELVYSCDNRPTEIAPIRSFGGTWYEADSLEEIKAEII